MTGRQDWKNQDRVPRFLIICLLINVLLIPFFVRDVSARVYIDISSPGFREIPVAIYEFIGPSEGRRIADIVRDDLQFSGVFSFVDRDAYIETPLPVFDSRNWLPLGVELVLKGSVTIDSDEVVVSVYLFDVVESRKILQKKYSARKRFVRILAHSISDDIYKRVTGEDGVFRTKIAFIGERNKRENTYLMDWDGKRLRNTGITGEHLLRPHWSADGAKLLYSAVRGKQWGVFMLDFRKRKERLLFRSQGINIAGDFFPGGTTFVFSSSIKGTPDLYLFDINRKKRKRLTRWLGIEISPSLSPDGGKIAFVSDRAGTPQLYIMDIDGRNLRRVTHEGNYNTAPVWSPRGDRIAYSGRINGKIQIFTVKLDGADALQLTERGNNEEPSFSPNGRFIAFTSDRDGKKAVYIMRANGEGKKRVTPKDMRAFGPSWSPNKIF